MSSRGDRSRRARGFTLIEVMVTVAIVAILAAIAMPAYSDYMRRGQVPEAFTFLSDYRVKMEQYYQDNRNYGVAGCADVNPPSWAGFGAQRYFTFSCTLSGATAAGGRQGYTLTATGATGRATGHVYTVDSANNRATTQFKGAASTKTCWLARGDEC
jgi:type IV pilus assembly protein PilE